MNWNKLTQAEQIAEIKALSDSGAIEGLLAGDQKLAREIELLKRLILD